MRFVVWFDVAEFLGQVEDRICFGMAGVEGGSFTVMVGDGRFSIDDDAEHDFFQLFHRSAGFHHLWGHVDSCSIF